MCSLFLMVMVPVLFICLFYIVGCFMAVTLSFLLLCVKQMPNIGKCNGILCFPHYSLQLALLRHLVDENYIGKILPLYKESMEGDPNSLSCCLSLQGLVLIRDKGWNGQLEDRPAPTTNPMPMEVKQLDLKNQRIGSCDKMSKCQNAVFLVQNKGCVGII